MSAALAMARRTRADVDVLELYDPFSVVTLCLLEEYGFRPPGTAGLTFRSGECDPGRFAPDQHGRRPVVCLYLQGMTPLAEGIIQVQGPEANARCRGQQQPWSPGIGGRIDHHACLVLDREAA